MLLSACGGGTRTAAPAPSPTVEEFPADAATLARGEKIFAENCASCHGQKGAGGVGPAPALAGGKVKECFPSASDELAFVKQGAIGKVGKRYGPAEHCVVKTGIMPAWEGQLSEEDLRAVVAYTRSL